MCIWGRQQTPRRTDFSTISPQKVKNTFPEESPDAKILNRKSSLHEKLWGGFVSIFMFVNQLKKSSYRRTSTVESSSNVFFFCQFLYFIVHAASTVTRNTDFFLLQLTSNEVICAFVRMHQDLQTQVLYYCVCNLRVRVRISSCTYGLPGVFYERPRTCFYTSWWR